MPSDGEKVYYRAEVVTQRDPLRVRSGPGTNYDVIGRLPKGEVVDVMVECPGGWAYIDDDGDQGYVNSSYLKRLPEEEQPQEDQPEIVNYGVLIPCDTKEQAEALAGFFTNATVISGDDD